MFSFEDGNENGMRGINQALMNIHLILERDRRKTKEDHESVVRRLEVILGSILFIGGCIFLTQGRNISARALV
jgi:hypothetical protein